VLLLTLPLDLLLLLVPERPGPGALEGPLAVVLLIACSAALREQYVALLARMGEWQRRLSQSPWLKWLIIVLTALSALEGLVRIGKESSVVVIISLLIFGVVIYRAFRTVNERWDELSSALRDPTVRLQRAHDALFYFFVATLIAARLTSTLGTLSAGTPELISALPFLVLSYLLLTFQEPSPRAFLNVCPRCRIPSLTFAHDGPWCPLCRRGRPPHETGKKLSPKGAVLPRLRRIRLGTRSIGAEQKSGASRS
jgi:hypothetical protein